MAGIFPSTSGDTVPIKGRQKPDDLDFLGQDGAVAPYTPTPEESKIIASVEMRYERWQRQRRPHEQQWFINAAFFRGQQYVEWNTILQAPVTSPAPSHRIRLVINKIFPKVRARQAKFLKTRPRPTVRPFTSDIEAREDARLTEKALDYIWRKARLEQAYVDALMWANITGHGYWWLYWDPEALGNVQITDPLTGQKQVEEVKLGDVTVEVDGCYSLMVADPGVGRIGRQSQIMRVKIRSLDYIRSRFPDKGDFVAAEATDTTGLRYERQISILTPTGTAGIGQVEDRLGKDENPKNAIVKELFTAPTPDWPKGRYQVVANGVLLKTQDELPYGFHNIPQNPFPVVDFPDMAQSGQYWITTVLEQLITPQREYNLCRSKTAEQLRLMAFPKLLAAVQHRIPNGAWTTAPGEFIPYVAQPNIPPPQILAPPNIAADTWRQIEQLDKEIQDITHIYPESEGRVGEATSGFQTNLLQEAADSVHAPDIRQHELAIEEAAIKIRRLMKAGYEVPRLLSLAGRDASPEVFEFSAADIDENAEIVVEAGSGLPTLKAARIQSILELFNAGLFGAPQDPQVSRKVLQMLEMSTIEDAFHEARQDQQAAELENKGFAEAKPVPPPEFFQNHQIHYDTHTSQLKSEESRTWKPEQRLQLIAHVILTVKFMNPQSAVMLAQQYGMPQLVEDLMQQMAHAAPSAPPGPNGAEGAAAAPGPDEAGMQGAAAAPGPDEAGMQGAAANSGNNQMDAAGGGQGPQGMQSAAVPGPA